MIKGSRMPEAIKRKISMSLRGRKKSKETRRKMKASFTPERIAILRHRFSGKNNPNYRKDMRGANNPFFGKKHSDKTKKLLREARLGKSSWAKGKKFSVLHRKRLSLSQAARVIRGDNLGFMSKGGYRKDLGHYVRSEWEANYARYLKYKGIKYQYEPERFWLKVLKCSYIPDFLLEDGTYVEVKGWDRPLAKAKRKAFRKQYGHRLVVIGRKRYNTLIGTIPNGVALEQERNMPVRPTIKWFDGRYAFLSNFYPAKVKYRGLEYPTVEHAYQAAKSKSKKQRMAIRRAPTPGQAKAMGRHVSLREGWDDIKNVVMYGLLKQKFQIPHLKKWLADTKGHDLIEGNWWNDIYWGVCNGVGENYLGKMLMQIRKENASGRLAK